MKPYKVILKDSVSAYELARVMKDEKFDARVGDVDLAQFYVWFPSKSKLPDVGDIKMLASVVNVEIVSILSTGYAEMLCLSG